MMGYNSFFACLLALVALVAQSSAIPTQEFPFGRIVGGVAASIEEHPYQVSIQKGESHFCGGSVIDSYTVVTAAHCLQTYAAADIKIRLGSTDRNSGGEYVSVRTLKYHEKYNSSLMINDVAVIKLDTPVRQTAKLRFIELAETTPASGTPAVVSGWGTTCFLFCSSPTSLLKAEVRILQQADCGSTTYKYGASKILETMVCADGDGEKKDACQGDSGGPLVADNKLVGIVSWGSGCAYDGYPGVYADVASLRKWILDTAATL